MKARSSVVVALGRLRLLLRLGAALLRSVWLLIAPGGVPLPWQQDRDVCVVKVGAGGPGNGVVAVVVVVVLLPVPLTANLSVVFDVIACEAVWVYAETSTECLSPCSLLTQPCFGNLLR